jgi:hypothetical protein
MKWSLICTNPAALSTKQAALQQQFIGVEKYDV